MYRQLQAPRRIFLETHSLGCKIPPRYTVSSHKDRWQGRRCRKDGGTSSTRRQATLCICSQGRRCRCLLDSQGEYAFHHPDTADSPKLYFSGTEDEATRCCCYRHYHESDSAGKLTMFRLDMQHARFRNMRFAILFPDYSTVDTPVEVFYYDILTSGPCQITMCPGASDCTFCYHFLRCDTCVCQYSHTITSL